MAGRRDLDEHEQIEGPLQRMIVVGNPAREPQPHVEGGRTTHCIARDFANALSWLHCLIVHKLYSKIANRI